MTLALLYAVLALGVPLVAEDAPANDTLVVSTAWVAERLNDPSLVLIHVGRRADYDTGHIPGAQFLEFSQIAIEDENGLRTQLPTNIKSQISNLKSAGFTQVRRSPRRYRYARRSP